MGKTISIRNWVGRAKSVEEGLGLSLGNLRERIKTLETERASLVTEIENLKKLAQSKANALETEVSLLREEVKSFKALLGMES